MVFKLSCTLLITFVLLTACRDSLQTKEKVQEAVVERLRAHSGLDLKTIDVTTSDVAFEKNTATATVVFHPKGDLSINSGMTMKYLLQEKDGKWVVTDVKNANGSSAMHPSAAPGAKHPAGTAQQLPSGHPSIPEPQKQ